MSTGDLHELTKLKMSLVERYSKSSHIVVNVLICQVSIVNLIIVKWGMQNYDSSNVALRKTCSIWR